jgi:hypothetical protein
MKESIGIKSLMFSIDYNYATNQGFAWKTVGP